MTSDWRLLFHPYYASHCLAFVSYLVLHNIALRSATDLARARLRKWEIQAALSLMVILLIKFVRRPTMEAFLVQVMLYSKVTVALLAFMLDWRLLAWYLVVFTILFLLFVQPAPKQQGKVSQLTPLQLENFLSDGNPNITWLVEFGAVWSPRCIQLMQVTADLSQRYADSGVQFARIDLGRFPSAAAKYGIAFGVALRQLPTFILFQGGTEVCRLPDPSYDTTETISQALIIHKFGLDYRLLQAMFNKLELSNRFRIVR